MKKLDWMRWMVDPLHAEKVKAGVKTQVEDYVVSAMPWTLERGGRAVTAAASQHTVIAVAEPGKYPEASSKIRGMLLPYIDFEHGGKLTELHTLRRWAGRTWKKPLPCTTCDGLWMRICSGCWGSGSHKARCTCGHEHECECPTCHDRRGVVFCPSCVGPEGFREDHCVVNGIVFNRTLISMALAEVQANTVLVLTGKPDEPLRIRDTGDSWSVSIMPMNLAPNSDYPHWS